MERKNDEGWLKGTCGLALRAGDDGTMGWPSWSPSLSQN
jgi:hypothetical protein